MSDGAEKIITAVESYATSLLESMGLELVEVQFRREGHGWVLRLFIEGEQGVTLDHCASVSRDISTWLDVEDLIEHAFHLEVSSPGVERPLKRLADFERFAGRKARIKLKEPRGERRVFTGILEQVMEDEFILVVDDEPVTIAFEEVAKARLTL